VVVLPRNADPTYSSVPAPVLLVRRVGTPARRTAGRVEC